MTNDSVPSLVAQTFKEAIRAKWLIMFTIVFFLLVINLPTLVLLAQGEMPQDYLNMYLQYLVTISFPYLPLLSLPIGALIIVEERESGTLPYVLSYPISRLEFLVGRVGGLFLATTAIIVFGYGIAALGTYSLSASASQYYAVGYVMFLAVCLNACMIGLSILVSILSRRKATALGIAIFLWFVFSVLSNIAYLGFITNLTTGPYTVLILTLTNPIAVSQVLAAFVVDPTIRLGPPGFIKYTLGSAAPAIMVASLVLWVAVFLVIDFVIFRRRDLI